MRTVEEVSRCHCSGGERGKVFSGDLQSVPFHPAAKGLLYVAVECPFMSLPV